MAFFFFLIIFVMVYHWPVQTSYDSKDFLHCSELKIESVITPICWIVYFQNIFFIVQISY